MAPVAIKNLTCTGTEKSIAACTSKSDETDLHCEDHTHDSVIKCTNNTCPFCIPNGKLRLIDSNGDVSTDGTGRLEMYWDGKWKAIHRDRANEGTAVAACRLMGF